MKGHGGLEDNVPTKSHNNRSPILDESEINKQLLERHARTFRNHIWWAAGGTCCSWSKWDHSWWPPRNNPEKKSSKGIVRITKRLRLDLKWKGKNEPCKWACWRGGMWVHLEDSKEVECCPHPTRGFRVALEGRLAEKLLATVPGHSIISFNLQNKLQGKYYSPYVCMYWMWILWGPNKTDWGALSMWFPTFTCMCMNAKSSGKK